MLVAFSGEVLDPYVGALPGGEVSNCGDLAMSISTRSTSLSHLIVRWSRRHLDASDVKQQPVIAGPIDRDPVDRGGHLAPGGSQRGRGGFLPKYEFSAVGGHVHAVGRTTRT